jgi:hypothetical protein
MPRESQTSRGASGCGALKQRPPRQLDVALRGRELRYMRRALERLASRSREQLSEALHYTSEHRRALQAVGEADRYLQPCQGVLVDRQHIGIPELVEEGGSVLHEDRPRLGRKRVLPGAWAECNLVDELPRGGLVIARSDQVANGLETFRALLQDLPTLRVTLEQASERRLVARKRAEDVWTPHCQAQADCASE